MAKIRLKEDGRLQWDGDSLCIDQSPDLWWDTGVAKQSVEDQKNETATRRIEYLKLYNNCKKESRMDKRLAKLKTFKDLAEIVKCSDCEYLIESVCRVTENSMSNGENGIICSKFSINFLPDTIKADCCNNCSRLNDGYGGCTLFLPGVIKEYSVCKYHDRAAECTECGV